MTTRTRRALVSVRQAARRLVRAVDALRPQDWKAIPLVTRGWVWLVGWCAFALKLGLTAVLGPDVPDTQEAPPEATP